MLTVKMKQLTLKETKTPKTSLWISVRCTNPQCNFMCSRSDWYKPTVRNNISNHLLYLLDSDFIEVAAGGSVVEIQSLSDEYPPSKIRTAVHETSVALNQCVRYKISEESMVWANDPGFIPFCRCCPLPPSDP